MAKLIRVIVYDGPDNWLDHEQQHMHLVPNNSWNVSASVDKGGGGGTITEVFRGTSEELIHELQEKIFNKDKCAQFHVGRICGTHGCTDCNPCMCP